jgi:hypothetical protein
MCAQQLLQYDTDPSLDRGRRVKKLTASNAASSAPFEDSSGCKKVMICLLLVLGTAPLQQIGGRNPDTESAPYINVLEGKCKSFGACVYSPNFPDDYDKDDKCVMRASAEGLPMFAVYFQVEQGFDYVKINGHKYDGQDGPEGVVPHGNFTFYADYTVQQHGFALCTHAPPSPPTPPSSIMLAPPAPATPPAYRIRATMCILLRLQPGLGTSSEVDLDRLGGAISATLGTWEGWLQRPLSTGPCTVDLSGLGTYSTNAAFSAGLVAARTAREGARFSSDSNSYSITSRDNSTLVVSANLWGLADQDVWDVGPVCDQLSLAERCSFLAMYMQSCHICFL